MQWSHSRVECFESCGFKYKMRYLDGLLTLPPDNADNALILGTALHTGIEKGVDAAIEEYLNAYPIITDAHITEAMKLEDLIPKARKLAPRGTFEKLISTSDFKGFIDLLVPTGNHNEYDLFDFKYSNNAAHYRDSPQLHIYKHFFEQANPNASIRNLNYLIVPKAKVKQVKGESLNQYRERIQDELNRIEPFLIPIEFDYRKVIGFTMGIKRAQETKEFKPQRSFLCRWCEYQQFCESEEDYMLLPKNERRTIATVNKHVVWLYGAPYSGKTTFANCFPDPLMLNTDGNIKFVDAPYIAIKNEVTVEGRMTKTKLAWEIFKESVAELERKENEFKSIIVDLLEDLYEHCRLYMYREMGITHESDDSFRAWDKVRTEFLSTLKRLMNLDYENLILISHEDTSKDITKRGGDKITAIKPNLQEKTANKVAGMVDIVARVIAEGDVHTLSFKTSEVIFGGGRLKVSTKEIPLEYGAFLKVYEDANSGTTTPQEQPTDSRRRKATTVKEDTVTVKKTPPEAVIPDPEPPVEQAQEEAPRRRRSSSSAKVETPPETVETEQGDDNPPFDTGETEAPQETETPKPEETTVRTRKRRA
ncbi:NTP-binding protein [Clostridia bacterium]|nr:NTP-binding protein [Clostridia bacterium]